MENSTSYGLTSPGWSNPFELQWTFFPKNYYCVVCRVSVVVFSHLVGIVANNGFLSSQASLKVILFFPAPHSSVFLIRWSIYIDSLIQRKISLLRIIVFVFSHCRIQEVGNLTSYWCDCLAKYLSCLKKQTLMLSHLISWL